MGEIQGTSNRGAILIVGAVPPLGFGMAIAVTSQPLPPQRRVGYCWVYAYDLSPPNQCYLIKRFSVYAPGNYEEFKLTGLGNAFGLRADVIFDESGLAYTIKLT